MNIERKQYGASVATEAGAGIVEAIVSVFGNTDHANEVVMPGAFKASLERKLPKGVWAHNWHMPIAKTLEARELAPGERNERGGLYIKGQFNLDTQAGREAYSNIKFGIIDEFSIGYRVVREVEAKDSDTRELHEIELYEWSPVLVGMNPETELLGIKSHVNPDSGITYSFGVAPASGDIIDPTKVPATFAYQADYTQAVNRAFTERAKALHELRAKEGRVLSTANRGRIKACIESIQGMQAVASDLEALLVMTEPAPAKAEEAEVRAIYAGYLQTVAKYR
jgi:HK97 family phage prohead protease